MAVPEGATKLGTVGIAYKGVYDELATYKYANAVYYNGSTYIALIDNPAGLPSNDGVNWRYLAQGFLQQAISALTVIDESGILGEVDAEVNAQEFLSKIAELEQGLENTKANKADILDTLEEIVANTEGGRIAGANAVSELNSNLKVNTYSIQLPSDWIGVCALYEYGNIGFISFNAYCTNQLNDGSEYGLFSLSSFNFNKSAVGIFKNNGANTTTIFAYLENGNFYLNPHGGSAEPNNYIRGTLVVFK